VGEVLTSELVLTEVITALGPTVTSAVFLLRSTVDPRSLTSRFYA